MCSGFGVSDFGLGEGRVSSKVVAIKNQPWHQKQHAETQKHDNKYEA